MNPGQGFGFSTLPNGGYLLEPDPIGIAGADARFALAELVAARVTEPVELAVAIPKAKAIASFVAGGRSARKGIAVVHCYHEPGIIDARLVLVSQNPEP